MPGVFSSRRNVLFDLDGTLIDSAPAHAAAFVAALAPGYPDLARRFHYPSVAGLTSRDTFIKLGLAREPELTDLIRRKQQLYREALERGEVGVFPGVADLLAQLHLEGRRLFLVTGASRISVQRILAAAQLAPYFRDLVTAEDAPRGKPAPAPYVCVLERNRLDRADSVAVEDGEHGVAAARAAGLDVITVHGEKGFPDGLHARNFPELGKLLGP